MGFEKRKDIIYINVANGSLVWQDKDKEKHYEFAYTGRLLKISKEQEEFEGKPLDKVKLEMLDTDTGQTAIIKMTDETFYVLGLAARLGNPIIDFAHRITLGVMKSDQNEKVSFCWMKQGDTKITPVEGFPKPEKVGKAYDWRGVTPEIDKVFAAVNAKLAAVAPPVEAVDEEEVAPGVKKDDLPF
jgi:hypothetical protein